MSGRTLLTAAGVVGWFAVELVHEFAVHCPGRIEGVGAFVEFALELGDSLAQGVVVSFEFGGAFLELIEHRARRVTTGEVGVRAELACESLA